jgi:metal-responsive CopG/Arc/MetJ family transcriptional regulator
MYETSTVAKDRVTITLDEDLLKRLDKLARQQDVTRSALIEQLVEEGIVEGEIVESPEVSNLLSALSSPSVVNSLTTAMGLSDDQQRVVARKMRSLQRPDGDKKPPKGKK